MKKARAAAEKFILDKVADMIPGFTDNVELLKAQFSQMSDKDFEEYMKYGSRDIGDDEVHKRTCIPFVLPNLHSKRLSIPRLGKLLNELGESPEQRLLMKDPVTGDEYLTPHKYLILSLPARRQSQTMIKKTSIPEGEQMTSDLTGQPTALSKGSRISQPELSSILSRGLDKSAKEMVNVRGGNKEAYREMKNIISEVGNVSLSELEGLGRATSATTLDTILTCMHIGNNISPDKKVPEHALPRND